MADELDSAIDILNKDNESKASNEIDELKENHEFVDDINDRTETESLLEQKKEKSDSLCISIPPTDDGIIEDLNDSNFFQENGQSAARDDSVVYQVHTSVKSRVRTINEQSTTTCTTPKPATPNNIPLPAMPNNIPLPAMPNNIPLPANPVNSNNRPSDENVRTSMSEQWKLMNPRLKCCICILIISNVVVGLVGATAFIMFITKECDKKPDVCNGNNYTGPQNARNFNENYFTGLPNEPFFQSAFPKKESAVNLKCFLPFKGTYTLKTDFENGSKGSHVTKICSESDKTHQYKLYCDKLDVTDCDIHECSEECSRFNINLLEMHLIVLQLDTSCLFLDARIAILNSTIK